MASLKVVLPVPPILLPLRLPEPSMLTLLPNTFFTLFSAPYTWPPVAASVLVAEIVPAVTLVIVLPPALIPVLVTLGPPVMVRPLVSSLLSPVVMLVTFKSSAKEKPIWLLVTLVLMLVSPAYLTVSPSATVSTVPLSASICRPLLSNALTALFTAVATLPAVAALFASAAVGAATWPVEGFEFSATGVPTVFIRLFNTSSASPTLFLVTVAPVLSVRL